MASTLFLTFVGCFSATVSSAEHASQTNGQTIECDIVVAGGSTASLAAAITAAEAAKELTVCFTEVTDWPGGQMTAGGVPAIDFGGANNDGRNQPASFRSAMESIPGVCTCLLHAYTCTMPVVSCTMHQISHTYT